MNERKRRKTNPTLIFYVEVWRNGSDYDADKKPDQVLKLKAFDASDAEDRATKDREYDVAIAHAQHVFEEPCPVS